MLPTYNERDNIAAVIARIRTVSASMDIVVVDDGSPDGTAGIVRELATLDPNLSLIDRGRKLGLGSAYMMGFEYALARGRAAVATMDADHSHDPALLPLFVRSLDDADLVIGSRYVEGGLIQNWGPARKVVSRIANGIVSAYLARQVRDCTSGYRVYSAALLRSFDGTRFRSQGFSMLVELLAEAVQGGARIIEHPIVFAERRSGKSKLRPSEILESLALYARHAFRGR